MADGLIPPGARPGFSPADSRVVVSLPTAVLPLFTATLFLSALLLFWIQPMVAKMVLPLLGGGPNVWNTAMMFFQATLLAGYAYAHLATRVLSLRRQILVHVAILAAAFVSLPVAVAEVPAIEGAPALWLLGLLAVSIGLPFFAVSATAPLLQRWFGQTSHPHARDPYFRYGASNLGSILALLGYPLLIEPLLRAGQQSWIWTGGYSALGGLILLCGFWMLRSAGPAAAAAAQTAAPVADERVSWGRRLHWTALAFAPSSLLLGVTAYLTTDVAAVPLLWVLPLVLYLLTYVLIFARKPPLRHRWMVAIQPYVLCVAFIALPLKGDFLTALGVHLSVFFVTAMVCHGELVKRRPGAGRLTEFYLFMAFGGMLGGVFNALVAPLLFPGIYEYALAMIAACALRPGSGGGGVKARLRDVALPGLLLAAVLASQVFAQVEPGVQAVRLFVLLHVVVAIAVFGFKERRLRFALGVAVALLAPMDFGSAGGNLTQQRSFFAVYRVKSVEDGRFHLLFQGTTSHGAQATDPALRREPLGYYARPGPLGQLFAALERGGGPVNIGLVGLGTGAALCYARPGQAWTAYEIDPLVARLAQTPEYFHYWSDCADPETTRLILGDARISLRDAPDGGFDLLILDAYNSDSVPVHLMTREALALYREKLSPNGLLMFHLSNRHLDLPGVLAALVADGGMSGRVQFHQRDKDAVKYLLSSIWAVAAAKEADLALLDGDPRWRPLEAPLGADVWTDDFSNIVRALK